MAEEIKPYLTNIEAYTISNLFWTNMSLEKPSKLPLVDEENKQNFNNYKIDWLDDWRTGLLTLKSTNRFNYALINDTYYFLDVDKYLGRDPKRLIRYKVTYDVWVNDILRKDVHISGILGKTLDLDLVYEQIDNISPVTQGCNRVNYLPARTKDYVPFKFIYDENWTEELNFKRLNLTEELKQKYKELVNKEHDLGYWIKGIEIPTVENTNSRIYAEIIKWLGKTNPKYTVRKMDLEKLTGLKTEFNRILDEPETTQLYMVAPENSGVIGGWEGDNTENTIEKIDLSKLKGIEFFNLGKYNEQVEKYLGEWKEESITLKTKELKTIEIGLDNTFTFIKKEPVKKENGEVVIEDVEKIELVFNYENPSLKESKVYLTIHCIKDKVNPSILVIHPHLKKAKLVNLSEYLQEATIKHSELVELVKLRLAGTTYNPKSYIGNNIVKPLIRNNIRHGYYGVFLKFPEQLLKEKIMPHLEKKTVELVNEPEYKDGIGTLILSSLNENVPEAVKVWLSDWEKIEKGNFDAAFEKDKSIRIYAMAQSNIWLKKNYKDKDYFLLIEIDSIGKWGKTIYPYVPSIYIAKSSWSASGYWFSALPYFKNNEFKNLLWILRMLKEFDEVFYIKEKDGRKSLFDLDSLSKQYSDYYWDWTDYYNERYESPRDQKESNKFIGSKYFTYDELWSTWGRSGWEFTHPFSNFLESKLKS